jgi:glycosyltransferase involved in cell wall biosynthesis
MGRTLIDISIPVYNEEKQLALNIERLHKFLNENKQVGEEYQIIIVDNASLGNTAKIASYLSEKYQDVSFIKLEKKGRGLALRESWKKSSADIVAYMDVDLSSDLNALHRLIEEIKNGNDLAIGSRLLKDSRVEGRTWVRELMSRTYNLLIRTVFHTSFHDAQCGFKAVRSKVFKSLEPLIRNQNWFFDTELLIIAEKSNLKIKELPVFWTDDPGSTVKVASTVFEDLFGLWRIFWEKPWKKL